MAHTRSPERLRRRRAGLYASGFAPITLLLALISAAPPGRALDDAMQRGRLIASGGGPGGVGAACFSCHGVDGGGQAVSGFPLIGGMDARYLARQLDDYASGAREDPIMSPVARQLSAEDRKAVAIYYARLSPRSVPLRSDPRLLQEGAVLYAIGSPDRGVRACIDCHGPGARGLPPDHPPLAGQHATYTAGQLRLWQAGGRSHGPGAVMQEIAARMTAREIDAVAAYVAALGTSASFAPTQ